MKIKGYDIVINEAYGDKWVSCGWREGKCFTKLPKSVIDEIKKRRPDVNIHHVMRKYKLKKVI